MLPAPEELQSHIVSWVAKQQNSRKSLHALCSTSRTLGRIASEAFYRDVKLYPDDAPFFLRTLFECPELGSTVRRLQVCVLLESNTALDPDLKAKSIQALHELGLAGSLWEQKIRDDGLPTVAGLILTRLPQLTELDIRVAPIMPNVASQSPWYQLFGSDEVPQPVAPVLERLRSLAIGGAMLPLLGINFPKLRTLRVRRITTPMLYPKRALLPGARGVEDLHLDATVKVANVEHATLIFGTLNHLIEAMNGIQITRLSIDLWAPDTFNPTNRYSAQQLLDQLQDIASGIRKLTINCVAANCVGDEMYQQSRHAFRERPMVSIERFSSLTTMIVPSYFLNTSSGSRRSDQPIAVKDIRLRTAPNLRISKCEFIGSDQHMTQLDFAPQSS
ncbi:hypothetical protein BU24DRAFT_457699 [Aaosphaeria arxii CBS 175.79]|uniref:F-box domain-containing protein n=1 Tax=Aaosphaeria arxii CBS 175.79 TaxID=1450172 RepID=A0A6A5Y9R6_9PLEO|nr:uncharacterized protein BU24DRAFT_457699 [Aaosphaeria arxii CBS 175.79]KAF2021757.1 hypothetical protein BU24DRAFT_457699 [Aaosphaeria arxii CBS 175.79]